MIPFAFKGSDFAGEEPYLSHFANEALGSADTIKRLSGRSNPNKRKAKIAYIYSVRSIILPHGRLPGGFEVRFRYPFPRNEQGLERRMRFMA